jgi:hypothetical protein
MAEPTLEERLARYGTSLDEARRQGVVPERPSVARRLVPAISFVTAFAVVIAAVVLIPRDDDAPDRLRPADVAAAEAEIRQAFETWVDETATDEERVFVRESLRDPARQARALGQWTAMQNALDARVQSFSAHEVSEIELLDDRTAFVDLTITYPGASVVVPAKAVLQDDRWRVGYATACALGGSFGRVCNPDDFLTEEEQAIGQPFVNIAWSELPDDQRVRDIEDGEEIRDQILAGVDRHRNMLGAKTQLLAVRHRPGEETAKVWWTVGTVQPGIAVLDGDRWTISRETWCKLSQNAGEYPPACGEQAPTTTTSTTVVGVVEDFTYEADGPLVRGARVQLTVTGLDRLRGRSVDVVLRPSPPYSEIQWTGILGSGTVGDAGSLVVSGVVPNWLSFGHDRLAIHPGAALELVLEAGDPEGVPVFVSGFEVRPAATEEGYRVFAYRNGDGNQGCGAPPVGLQFDGRFWVADDPSGIPATEGSHPGTFTLLSDTTARLTLADGRTVPFTQSEGWSC